LALRLADENIEGVPVLSGGTRPGEAHYEITAFITALPLSFATFGAEERPEALLLEMPVVGEHVGQSFPAHGLHRDAVGEAITFVRSGGVKIEPGQKRLMALRDDKHIIVGKDLPHRSARRDF